MDTTLPSATEAREPPIVGSRSEQAQTGRIIKGRIILASIILPEKLWDDALTAGEDEARPGDERASDKTMAGQDDSGEHFFADVV